MPLLKVIISPNLAARTFRLLVLAASCLTLVSFAAQTYAYLPEDWALRGALSLLDQGDQGLAVLSTDAESSVPAWFSSALLLLCSPLALSAPGTGREHAERYPGHWKALAILLLLMSLDEAASLHEGAIEPLRSALGTGGPFYYAWVIPGMVFVLAFALARGFLLGLPPKTRAMFAVAGTLYVCGSLVMEMVGGAYSDSYGEAGIAYVTITSVEEYLEMLGVATLLYALMILHTGKAQARAGTAAEASGFRAEA
jgi:hypothetical protein